MCQHEPLIHLCGCGGKPIIRLINGGYKYECSNCGALGPSGGPSKTEARKAWNVAHHPSVYQAEIMLERLKTRVATKACPKCYKLAGDDNE